jgi:hypothetical protein
MLGANWQSEPTRSSSVGACWFIGHPSASTKPVAACNLLSVTCGVFLVALSCACYSKTSCACLPSTAANASVACQANLNRRCRSSFSAQHRYSRCNKTNRKQRHGTQYRTSVARAQECASAHDPSFEQTKFQYKRQKLQLLYQLLKHLIKLASVFTVSRCMLAMLSCLRHKRWRRLLQLRLWRWCGGLRAEISFSLTVIAQSICPSLYLESQQHQQLTPC